MMRPATTLLLGLSAILGATAASADAPSSASTKTYNAKAAIEELPACPADREDAEYDYIVVGAGAGGGPAAARLALNGFKVLVIEAGVDHENVNTTIPLYFLRATEDEAVLLAYEVDLYPPNDKKGRKVTNWYPRAQGLGGCTIHNALVNQIGHDWDWNTMWQMFGDESWNATQMAQYYTRIEDNLFMPKDVGVALGHGYTGWLSTQAPPSTALTDPAYHDQKLIDFVTVTGNAWPDVPNKDWTSSLNDLAEGGGMVSVTINANKTRSSVRDHLVAVQARKPNLLKFQLSTLATKVLTCRETNGKIRAYGVETVPGAEIRVSSLYKGKFPADQKKTNFYAKYEIIVSTGAYQTPQLLMLSGMGDATELEKFDITPLVNLPGIGQNLQDRTEITVVWLLNSTFKIWDGCIFGPSEKTDPCLKAWETEGRSNLYGNGPGGWAHSFKSSPTLPYRDMWSQYGVGSFKGYYPGWGNQTTSISNAWGNNILKGHTASSGWVKLTGSHPQDLLNLNKNLGQVPGYDDDVELVAKEVIAARKLVHDNPTLNRWVVGEYFPGKQYETLEQLKEFIELKQWGHHACCTAKMGIQADESAVITQNFQVYGVNGLRIVDNSVWANIPGFFVTTPIYMIAEKAADVITAFAKEQGWKPTA